MASRFLIPAALLLLALAAGAYLLPRGNAVAQEEIDISGEWAIDIKGDIPASCSSHFTQSDTQVSGTLNCAGVGTGNLSGTIDPATGSFSLTGTISIAQLEIEGTGTQDGMSINGTWSAFDVFSGTFTGTRKTDQTAADVDLTGTWVVEFVGGVSRSCTADIQQAAADVTAIIECGEDTGTANGTVSSQQLHLKGMLFDSNRQMAASVTQDGNAIGGTWQASSGGASGGFVAVRNEKRSGSFDMTGVWDTALTGAFLPITCDTVIEQTSTELASVLSCGIAGAGALPALSTLERVRIAWTAGCSGKLLRSVCCQTTPSP